MEKSSFSIGDKIIDSDQIYVIVKIENDRVFYKPLNDNSQNQSNYTCSIPLVNLSLASIRPLLTESEVKIFLENLCGEEPISVPFGTKNTINNSNFLKEILYQNNPNKTGKLLVYLSKIEKESKLSRTDQSIYDQALSHLADEISSVNKISFDAGKEKILTALKNNSN